MHPYVTTWQPLHVRSDAESEDRLCAPQVVGFIYTAIVIVIRGTEIVVERGDIGEVKLFNWGFEALFAIPIVVFGFNCHANVVTIFS